MVQPPRLEGAQVTVEDAVGGHGQPAIEHDSMRTVETN